MDVDKGDKDTFSKVFSSWTLGEVCLHILNISPAEQDVLPELDIDELGPQKKLPKEDYEGFINTIKETKHFFKITRLSNESKKREILSDFLKTVYRYILKEKKIILNCETEMELKGTCGYGKADYCILYEQVILIVIEAKKDDFKKGIAQAIVAMNVALEGNQKSKKCSTIYGIVSDGFEWIFVQFTLTTTEGAKVKVSNFQDGMQDSEIIFDWILRILEIQIKNMTDMGVDLKTINSEQFLTR